MVRLHNKNRQRRVEVQPTPEELLPAPPDGKVRCPSCHANTSLTQLGYLRKHRDLAGFPCTNKRPLVDVQSLDVLPEVSLVDHRASTPDSPRGRDAWGECRECGKWLPGQRTLCGLCGATLEDARKRR